MRIIVTGHRGYIGTVLVEVLMQSGHDVTGIDSDLYQGCDFGELPPPVPSLRRDIRDIQPKDLAGAEAIVHLAALSNDPVGALDPTCTYAINHEATVRLGRLAKDAGVRRFVFASSCSVYGASDGEDLLDETAPRRPVTAYGISKAKAEDGLADLADDSFAPIFLRNATAYGVSPRLRSDLVVNNLAGHAFLSGTVLLKSNGLAWRPIVHIRDIAQAIVAVLDAPTDRVRNEVFNVGQNCENYRIRDLAEMCRSVITHSSVQYAEGAATDVRCYRVDCSKIRSVLPAFQPTWDARRGIEELYAAYRAYGLCAEHFEGQRFVRIERLRALLADGQLDAALRWCDGQPQPTEAA